MVNHVQVPAQQEKENTFTERKKGAGRAIINRVHDSSLAESLPGKKSRVSPSCWALLLSQGMRAPLSGSQLFVIEVSIY